MADELQTSAGDFPRIVVIETSGRVGSVAVAAGPKLLAQQQFSSAMKHGIELMPAIRDLTVQQGWAPHEIQQVYLSIGPGSFTGLRIAVMVARSLAQALGALVVAVPTLDVLALNAPAEVRNLAVVLDAKRGQVYAARYRQEDVDAPEAKRWLRTAGPMLANPQDLVRQSPKPLGLIGEGIDYHRPALWAGVTEAAELIELSRESWIARAAAVHTLGWALAQRGAWVDPRRLIPLYIRLPEAEELWNQRHPQAGTANGESH